MKTTSPKHYMKANIDNIRESELSKQEFLAVFGDGIHSMSSHELSRLIALRVITPVDDRFALSDIRKVDMHRLRKLFDKSERMMDDPLTAAKIESYKSNVKRNESLSRTADLRAQKLSADYIEREQVTRALTTIAAATKTAMYELTKQCSIRLAKTKRGDFARDARKITDDLIDHIIEVVDR